MERSEVLENAHLREYVRIGRKHLWLMLSCFVVVVGAVALGTYLQQPVYRGVTKALISSEAPKVMNIQEVTPSGGDTMEQFQTQVQVIRSRPVVQRVIDSMGLLARRPSLASSADPVEAFLKDVTVEPIRNTRLVEIGVEDSDPKLAAELANTLAATYVHQNLELKFAAARDALTWLTAQAQDLKSKVNESELALQKYREQSGLVQVEEKQGLTARKLAEFNSTYIDAKAKRLEMEARLTELRKASQQREALESSPIVINNPVIQRIKGQLVELEVQKSKLLKTFREKHPEVVKIQSQIDEVNQKLREEVDRLALSMESEYSALKARENAMLQAVNQYRDESQNLARKEIQFGVLKRDADSNQQLYDALLKRLKETGLSQGLDTNNVRIVEPAVPPVDPIRPRKLMNLLVGVVLGAGMGVMLAFFVEYMDDTVRTPEQVERVVAVPVFALIPMIPGRSRS
jgi:polysaccharide biosynthesis transport protein